MKKDINKLPMMIMEQVSADDYTNDDFVDVYITVFKNWIKKNYGEQELKYPFSYLKKKYENEFYKLYNLTKGMGGEYLAMTRAGKKLVDLALHSYEKVPTSESSWFDNPVNQKIWKAVEKEIKLPSYMNVEVVETRPRNLELRIDVDFVDFIKSPETNPYPVGSLLIMKIQEFMSKYGGVKFGNPLHGELRLYEGYYRFNGHEEWYEKELKRIKQEVKNKVTNHSYRGLKYDNTHGHPKIKVLFTSSGWTSKDDAFTQVINTIRDMGYSQNLKISNY